VTETSYTKGINAETSSKRLLESKGYRCLAERYKSPYGEIDLLMMDQDNLVAVEVKFRKTEAGTFEAISIKQRKRIENALLFYLNEHPEHTNSFLRFDVVLISPMKPLVHILNAWQTDENENTLY
jgi:putative endonuclease